MNSLLEKIDLGTSPFFCENCGEVSYGYKFILLEEFDSVASGIEEICEYCAESCK